MSAFDKLQKTVFKTCAQMFGTSGVWASSLTEDLISAEVLFNDPTRENKLSGAGYEPKTPTLEYKDGDFPGLFEVVADGSIDEKITVAGVEYIVREVDAIHDGKTFLVTLTKP